MFHLTASDAVCSMETKHSIVHRWIGCHRHYLSPHKSYQLICVCIECCLCCGIETVFCRWRCNIEKIRIRCNQHPEIASGTLHNSNRNQKLISNYRDVIKRWFIHSPTAPINFNFQWNIIISYEGPFFNPFVFSSRVSVVDMNFECRSKWMPLYGNQ